MIERFLYSSHDENHDGSHPWRFCKLMSELPWQSYGQVMAIVIADFCMCHYVGFSQIQSHICLYM